MAGSLMPGSLCAISNARAIDTGTNPRTCMPAPGSLVAHHSARRSTHASASLTQTRALVIGRARLQALALLRSRRKDLHAWDPATAHCFVGWFGTDDTQARMRIAKRIDRAIAKLNALRVTDFVSDNTSSDYAYVSPGTTERGLYERTVHLGSAFWTADDKTRAGTLVHECSHFNSVGRTDDVGDDDRYTTSVDFPGKNKEKYDSAAMYGRTRATRLAMYSSKLALNNAENFEFFIEGRDTSLLEDESGRPDFEGIGDFPDVPSRT